MGFNSAFKGLISSAEDVAKAEWAVSSAGVQFCVSQCLRDMASRH